MRQTGESTRLSSCSFTFFSSTMRLSLILLACILSGLSSFSAAQELLWSDEFDSGSVPNSSVWSYNVGGGGWGNGELQEYTTENVRVQDGYLIISVQEESSVWGVRTITSGRIRSNGKLEFQYGTVEARIKVPDAGDGLRPALWMLGTTFPEVGWPKSGEIDIMSVGSARAIQLGITNTRVGSAVHWEASGGTRNDYNELDTPFDLTADFYTYRMEWTPDAVTTYVDGIQIFEEKISSDECLECEELHQPFFFVLNVAAGGGYTRIYQQAGITAPLPAELVVDYIRVYDNGFTKLSGSAAPGASPPPSLEPTSQPTLASTTLAASNSPSNPPALSSPTPRPTSTLEPTPSPSSSPTHAPTQVSTLVSTPVETTSPSALPSLQPGTTPKGEPSPSPTAQPSSKPRTPNSLVHRFDAKGITMTLSNVEPLNEVSGMTWAEITGDYLATEIREVIGLELVDAVEISIAIVSQDPPFMSRRALASTRESNVAGDILQRDLQAEQKITFDAVVLIQSVVEDHDVNRYIVGAFNSDTERALYLATLKATGDRAFLDASAVSVTPAVSVSRMEAPDSDSDGGVANIVVIVGAVLAGVCMIALVAFFLYIRTRKRDGTKNHPPPGGAGKKSVSDMETGAKAKANPLTHRYPSGTSSDVDDDSFFGSLKNGITPSTCDDEESLYTETDAKPKARFLRSRYPPGTRGDNDNDSIFGGLDIITPDAGDDGDDDVSFLTSSAFTADTGDFDYESAYQATASVVTGSLAQSEFTSQSGFVQNTVSSYLKGKKIPVTKFQVQAPAGKLGLVLDTCEDGTPVVDEIVSSSPLAGQVRVGDRLLSLDGQDVTTMIATTVARLIASKKNNRVRQFTFARPGK